MSRPRSGTFTAIGATATSSRFELLEGVWGEASESASGSLEVLIARLRKKLGADLIRTLRGEGYALTGGSRHGPRA